VNFVKPDIDNFRLFYDSLMLSAPEEYEPWFFKLQAKTKVPIAGRSWKAPGSKMGFKYALKWMDRGGNIGIAGRSFDGLVNIDLDGENVKKSILPPTLTTRSRSRTGIHGFYFTENKDEIPNIPTSDQGEVRSQDQYVVAAGSFVPVDNVEGIPEQWRDRAGYYTVEDAQPPAWIKYEDLPQIFRDHNEERKNRETRKPVSFDPVASGGKHSALYTITAQDVVIREGGEINSMKRWGSIFHDSDTEQNMSFSSQGLLQCWRHGVSHNGLTSLVVLSGYLECEEAGTPHKGGGQSLVVGDDGAILHAWIYAKNHNYIPQDDPVPSRALNHIADKHLGFKAKPNERLPWHIYINAIKILEGL